MILKSSQLTFVWIIIFLNWLMDFVNHMISCKIILKLVFLFKKDRVIEKKWFVKPSKVKLFWTNYFHMDNSFLTFIEDFCRSHDFKQNPCTHANTNFNKSF